MEKNRRPGSYHPAALKPNYPSQLPIVQRRLEIVDAIRKHQVVVLSGETGSGKTTQIPKMCIEAGRGRKGLIGCTQPRRIAALTVSARIAEELKNKEAVGCRIRFHDSSHSGNIIRIMTDGILLAEAQNAPSLKTYDTIIIDEAHERSLNIDVLLGMVRRLIDKRRDLKVIITSATLDTEKFSRHFSNAPIMEVSGRTYPVEILYEAPQGDEAELSLAEQAARAVHRIIKESRSGDVLVFLPTEQDIRDTVELVSRDFPVWLNVLPLYARLPSSEQQKAFETGGKRKVVVATNVAETSLTIPGIRYVVDTGLARISRYNPGTGTHGLPVEPISRASADQRAGRCGRVEDGVCIRLYSEEDYSSRQEYTAPEIHRTNLAEVILRLLDIGISDIKAFPFVDPPTPAAIRDGLRTLNEIGAIEERKTRQLTVDGRLMARLPLDPRLARMLIQADREECLGDVLPIAAALSLPDPREKPPEKAGSAETAHAVFRNDRSDFVGWLNIWDGFRTSKKQGSYTGKLKRYCRDNYLSFRRMREWMDVHRQLALVMEENGYRIHRMKETTWLNHRGDFSPRYTAVHRSVLSGLLSHVARREESGIYEATRNRKAYIYPGSALKKSKAPWIVSAEIVRTSRLFARSAAEIDPEWLCDLGAHLVKKSWVRPHWSRKAGAVMAEEQVRLFGFLIADSAVVPYGPINPMEAREIFIRHALVEATISESGGYEFLRANAALLRRLKQTEAKLRRKDLVAGDDALIAFYDERLPIEILDLETLNRYLKAGGPNANDKHLRMDESHLLTGLGAGDALDHFPDTAVISGERWKISYLFDPDSSLDGVTLKIPAGRLSELHTGSADWLVPGLLVEKAEALMRALPKAMRKRLIPISETAVAAVRGMKHEGDFVHALSAWLYRERQIDIPPVRWNPDAIPEHLRIRFALLDETGRESASGRDLSDLNKNRRSGPASARPRGINRYRRENERSGLTEWPEDLQESVRIPGGAVLWPWLRDDGQSVSLCFADDRMEAERLHLAGQKRLALLHWGRSLRDFKRSLPLAGEARVAATYLGGPVRMEEALWDRILTDIFAAAMVRRRSEWETLLETGGKRIYGLAQDYLALISQVLECYGETRRLLSDLAEKSHRRSFILECLATVEEMVAGEFVHRRSPEVWKAMPRWFRATLSRARKGAENPMRDRRFTDVWNPLNNRLTAMISSLSPMASDEKRLSLEEAEIMMQELRVALSAVGDVRPGMKISESRMVKFLDKVDRML